MRAGVSLFAFDISKTRNINSKYGHRVAHLNGFVDKSEENVANHPQVEVRTMRILRVLPTCLPRKLLSLLFASPLPTLLFTAKSRGGSICRVSSLNDHESYPHVSLSHTDMTCPISSAEQINKSFNAYTTPRRVAPEIYKGVVLPCMRTMLRCPGTLFVASLMLRPEYHPPHLHCQSRQTHKYIQLLLTCCCRGSPLQAPITLCPYTACSTHHIPTAAKETQTCSDWRAKTALKGPAGRPPEQLPPPGPRDFYASRAKRLSPSVSSHRHPWSRHGR